MAVARINRMGEQRGGAEPLTAEGMRGALSDWFDQEMATDQQLEEAGLTRSDLRRQLLALEKVEGGEQRVRFEVRVVEMTLPERSIVATMAAGRFIHTVFLPNWNDKMAVHKRGQPQAQWSTVAVVIEDLVKVGNQAVLRSSPRGMGGQVEAGDLGRVDMSMDGRSENAVATITMNDLREEVRVTEREVRIRAVIADLVRTNLVDPGRAEPGAKSTDLTEYVDKGRIYRLMPASLRRVRSKAEEILAIAEKLEAEAAREGQAAQAAFVEARLSTATQEGVDALRKAKMTDDAIAAMLGVDVAALVAKFGGGR